MRSTPLRRAMRAVLALAALVLVTGSAEAAMLDLYVSPEGNDAWNGRQAWRGPGATEGPFATLERARDFVRTLKRAGTVLSGGVTVWLRGGDYTRDRSFVLTKADSGTPDAPIVYRAYNDEKPCLVGGRVVKDWHRVSDSATIRRLPVRSLGKVWVAELGLQGIHGIPAGAQKTASLPAKVAGLELFFNDKPMPLAAWPNKGWATISAAPHGKDGDCFAYTSDEPNGWKDPTDLWVHGFWTWDWADSYVKVDHIDPVLREVITRKPYGVYGYTPGKRWRAVGTVELIDEPGEWCYDREANRLFFYPPSSLDEGRTIVSLVEDPLISLQGASDVTLRGLTIECGLGAGIEIVGGSDDLVVGCTLRDLGTWGVWVGNGLAAGQWFDYGNVVKPRDGGEHDGVTDCDLYDLGGGGVLLAGGDRLTLMPSRHYAEDNDIHDYGRWDLTYKAGISIDGVGTRVANNLIYNAPHQAIFVNGNDNLIELNEIHDVCLQTGDAGAFYMGRDWAQRGNIVRWNYFHDLRAGNIGGETGFSEVMAVYLDDWMSGTTVFGNIFYKAGRAVLIGGGRDNIVENNIFVDCHPAVHVDARGLSWAKNYFNGDENVLLDRLKAVHYDQPPYSTRYPHLATILSDDPAMPKGNRIERNICVGGKWLDLLDGLTNKTVDIRNNLTQGDPGFVNAAKGDFRLKKDSPAWKLGFEPIPFDRIGLRRKP